MDVVARGVEGHHDPARSQGQDRADGKLLRGPDESQAGLGTREGWGTRVIDRLSMDIKREVPDARGFSPRNFRFMRTFAAAWPDLPVAQLPWRHQVALLDRAT